jgi:hypothetical protein
VVELVDGGRALRVRAAPGATVALRQGEAPFPARGVEHEPWLFAAGVAESASTVWPPVVQIGADGEARVERRDAADVHGVVQPWLSDEAGAVLAVGEAVAF